MCSFYISTFHISAYIFSLIRNLRQNHFCLLTFKKKKKTFKQIYVSIQLSHDHYEKEFGIVDTFLLCRHKPSLLITFFKAGFTFQIILATISTIFLLAAEDFIASQERSLNLSKTNLQTLPTLEQQWTCIHTFPIISNLFPAIFFYPELPL